MTRLFLTILFLPIAIFSNAQTIPAFPGAEGGGMYTTGGRGGDIYFVDNLNNKGKGSLRKAIEKEGARTIIFRVSGTIELEKPIYIKNDSVTIAGQTAPGDGICLKNYGIKVEADNVIIRYLRIRPGDSAHKEMDAATGKHHQNIIIDHCSFSWADDEVASFYDNENFTMQWCIISESFYKSFHHKGEHGYGGIWGGQNASFHHNLLSDHTSRNPRFCGSRFSGDSKKEKVDFRNNVIYNWGYNSAYGGEEGYCNIIKNYYKPGPATKKGKQNRILELTQKYYDKKVRPDTLHAGWFYISGNEVEGFPETTANNWSKGVQGKKLKEEIKNKSKLKNPVTTTMINTDDAKKAYKKVLKQAGASLKRDAIDKRITKEVRKGKEQFGASYLNGGKGIIDSQNDVGGWTELKSDTPLPDSDNDGMPDKWEKKHKLNPQKADNNKYTLDNNYTNIEVYINSLIKIKTNKFYEPQK